MMNDAMRPHSIAIALAFALAPVYAQQPLNPPLKNWATPLYWHPNQAEREAAARPVPELKFSANQISADALTFVAITPCRLVDTRGAAAGFIGVTPFNGPGVPAGGGNLTFPVQSSAQTSTTAPAPCGAIPSFAAAYSINLTVVPVAGGAVDNVSLWPAGSAQPFVATLNDPQGSIAQNAAIVPAGTPFGGFSFHSTGPAATDIIIDMNGYYTAPTDASNNTAVGTGTLASNTTGAYNTASGANALANNTTGNYNTASGLAALEYNTAGADNTASGAAALENNTTGGDNTANGFAALQYNTTGYDNTASGSSALRYNTTGGFNTASGGNALNNNTIGSDNMASGGDALFNNTTGGFNTASGGGALQNNTTGSNNIAIGYVAAYSVAGGNSNNIHIGSEGASGDSGVIKIGTDGAQTSAFMAGISGKTASGGMAVYIDSGGKLGTATSARRFKEQITDMGDSSSKLFQLRPVNFFYKPEYDDGSHLLQYGLIAEEVAKVYPEMVAYDNDGQILTVRYQLLAPMLLNEVQKQNAQLQEENAQLQNEVQIREAEDRKLEDRLAALEALLSSQTAAAARPASSQ